jgi:hypothetical protein
MPCLLYPPMMRRVRKPHGTLGKSTVLPNLREKDQDTGSGQRPPGQSRGRLFCNAYQGWQFPGLLICHDLSHNLLRDIVEALWRCWARADI